MRLSALRLPLICRGRVYFWCVGEAKLGRAGASRECSSLREAKRRSNPGRLRKKLDCFAPLAMTRASAPRERFAILPDLNVVAGRSINNERNAQPTSRKDRQAGDQISIRPRRPREKIRQSRRRPAARFPRLWRPSAARAMAGRRADRGECESQCRSRRRALSARGRRCVGGYADRYRLSALCGRAQPDGRIGLRIWAARWLVAAPAHLPPL
jgi:hypothetical protein